MRRQRHMNRKLDNEHHAQNALKCYKWFGWKRQYIQTNGVCLVLHACRGNGRRQKALGSLHQSPGVPASNVAYELSLASMNANVVYSMKQNHLRIKWLTSLGVWWATLRRHPQRHSQNPSKLKNVTRYEHRFRKAEMICSSPFLKTKMMMWNR